MAQGPLGQSIFPASALDPFAFSFAPSVAGNRIGQQWHGESQAPAHPAGGGSGGGGGGATVANVGVAFEHLLATQWQCSLPPSSLDPGATAQALLGALSQLYSKVAMHLDDGTVELWARGGLVEAFLKADKRLGRCVFRPLLLDLQACASAALRPLRAWTGAHAASVAGTAPLPWMT
jgi:hypothetical protein